MSRIFDDLKYEKNGWKWKNVPKNTWGPIGWHWLHMIAIAYPVSPTNIEKELTNRRLWRFINNLPCSQCRSHATQYVLHNLPNLNSSKDFQIWVWNFHNEVNLRIRKPLVSFQQYLRNYSAAISPDRRNNRFAE